MVWPCIGVPQGGPLNPLWYVEDGEPISQIILLSYSNLVEISFCHPNSGDVIAMKFYRLHDRCAVTACTKFGVIRTLQWSYMKMNLPLNFNYDKKMFISGPLTFVHHYSNSMETCNEPNFVTITSCKCGWKQNENAHLIEISMEKLLPNSAPEAHCTNNFSTIIQI